MTARSPLPVPVAIAIACRILDTNASRSAVYTCGVMLWELLTGQTFERGASGRARRVREVRDDCPPAVDAIVARATSLDRTQTFASPRAMSRVLSQAVMPAPAHEIDAWFEKAS